MIRAVVFALLLSGCLERELLGVVPEDGGCPACEPDAGPAADAALSSFARELCRGPWAGTASAEGFGSQAIELTFTCDGSYVARCVDDPDPACAPFPVGLVENGRRGSWWLTDHTPSGEFWGLTRDDFRTMTGLEGLLDHMVVDGDRLTFDRRQRFGIFELGPSRVVLTRAR